MPQAGGPNAMYQMPMASGGGSFPPYPPTNMNSYTPPMSGGYPHPTSAGTGIYQIPTENSNQNVSHNLT